MRVRARALAAKLSLPVLGIAAFFVWSSRRSRTAVAGRCRPVVIAAAGPGRGDVLVPTRHEGWAFVATAVAIVTAVAALFLALYPNVMPSTIDKAFSLTVHNASSTHYTLTVMTWVAVHLHAHRAGLPGLDVLGVSRTRDGQGAD